MLKLLLQETNTMLAMGGTVILATILYLEDFGLRILSLDILDRFTNYIALLVGTHTMCHIRNTLITCTV